MQSCSTGVLMESSRLQWRSMDSGLILWVPTMGLKDGIHWDLMGSIGNSRDPMLSIGSDGV